MSLSETGSHSGLMSGAGPFPGYALATERRGFSVGLRIMVEGLVEIVQSVGATFTRLLPISIALGVVFAALSHFWACNPARPWWRKRELVTDICYWFLIPLAALPLWLQAIIFLIGSDLIMYWSHRIFHGPTMWKYHAVHHSSKELDWISAARFHPVNIALGSVAADVIMLVAGISPNALVILGPFTIAHSAFVHANLNWSLGPLRYVIAGPLFHRWHHTAADEGGEKNFAPTFPVLDLIFGTFYLPKNTLPASYGVADQAFPSDFGAQMIHPFKQ